MKKTLIIAFLGIAFYSNAQETETIDFNKNEIKLNMLYFVLGATEVSYERNLSNESSVGISFLIPSHESVRDEVNFAITPYYRLFFGNKPAQGFFIEGFGMLNSTEQDYHSHSGGNSYSYLGTKTSTDFALGVSVGGKFVLKEKIVADVHLGVGRNLFQNYESPFSSPIVPRFNIGVGYLF